MFHCGSEAIKLRGCTSIGPFGVFVVKNQEVKNQRGGRMLKAAGVVVIT